MTDVELAKFLQRLKITTMLQYLAPIGQPARYETVLSFLARNPSTHEEYWEAPSRLQDAMGTMSVTLAPGDATLLAINEESLTVQVPGEQGGEETLQLPLDYLYQLECLDAYGDLFYLDMFPLLIDVPLYTPPAPRERPKLQLVVNN